MRSNNNLIVLDKSQAKVHASPPPPEMQCFFFFVCFFCFVFLLFQDVHIDRFSHKQFENIFLVHQALLLIKLLVQRKCFDSE